MGVTDHLVDQERMQSLVVDGALTTFIAVTHLGDRKGIQCVETFGAPNPAEHGVTLEKKAS